MTVIEQLSIYEKLRDDIKHYLGITWLYITDITLDTDGKSLIVDLSNDETEIISIEEFEKWMNDRR